MSENLKRIFFGVARRGYLQWINDNTYLKIVYKMKLNKNLDLKHPVTFNEKLQWLKVNDRKPEYSSMVDKYAVKKMVTEVLGKEYVIPTIGIWDRVDEIDFDKLPNKFVLKCTHDSGGVVICKDKATFDIEQAKIKLNKALRTNFYYIGREWPYKNVKPRVIAEEYVVDDSGSELKDYKVMCFEGTPRLIQIHRGRFISHTQDFYDTQWNKLMITQGVPMSSMEMERPQFLDEMLALSQMLAQGLHEIRIDWYYVRGHLLFGEFTFFDASGHCEFEPKEWNKKVGEWIKLPID